VSQDSSRTRLLAKITKAREKLASAKVKATTDLLDGIDEFVRSVLEIKSALVEAVVDGAALTPGATRDVLSELEHMVARPSAHLADGDVPLTDEEWVNALLDEVKKETEPAGKDSSMRKAIPPISREAILALARVLTRPAATVYELASGSNPSKKYVLTFEANEVTCTCTGFEYRGTCRHARDLNAALVSGKPVPSGYNQATGS